MKQANLTTVLLGIIAASLTAIAIRPYVTPAPAQAQTMLGHEFYIEPGVQMLRLPTGDGQVWGKMMIDLRTGQIWGFPTYTTDPYPSPPNLSDPRPTTSHPFRMGKFAFEDTDK